MLRSVHDSYRSRSYRPALPQTLGLPGWLPTHSHTLCPCRFPEVDGRAQTSCSLLSDPGDLTPATLAQDGVQARGRGSTWTIPLSCLHSTEHRENVGAGADTGQPTGGCHPISATRSPPRCIRSRRLRKAPRDEQGHALRPRRGRFTSSNSSTSKQQPLLLLPPSLPSAYPFTDIYGAAPLSQALHERMSPSEQPSASNRNGALMHSWLRNAGRLSTALGAALPLGLTLLFFP